MTTVDKSMADLMVERNGRYMDDPQVTVIIKYWTFNSWNYKLTYSRQEFKKAYSYFLLTGKKPDIYWALRPKEAEMDEILVENEVMDIQKKEAKKRNG